MVEINKKNENKYMVTVMGAAIFLSLALGFIVGKPLYDSLQKTGAELNEKKETLEKLEVKLATLKTLESRRTELEKRNQKVIAAFPDDKDIARLFYQFEAIATSAGVEIKSVNESSTTAGAVNPNSENTIDTPDPTNNAIISPVSYQVSASADSYEKLKNALINIEESLRILSIDSLQVQNESGKLNINLVIKTYKRG